MISVTARLGEIAEVAAGGGAPQSDNAFTDKGTPFIRAGSLYPLVNGASESTLEHLSEAVAKEHRLRKFPRDTVVFAKSGMSATKGHVYRLRDSAYVVNHLAAIVPSQRVLPGFLEHALRVYSPVQLIQDAAYPSVRLSDVASMQIPLPPLAEQRRIAEILDRAEALRAKRRAALAQLDSLAQSLFLEMFGDPVSNPRAWKTIRLAELCERVTVGIVVKPASYYASEGVPALRSLNIRPGKIMLQDVVYIAQRDNDTKLAKTKLKAGDLVLVRSGQPGTAAVVPQGLDGANAIDLLIATPIPKLTDVTFLCEFFNSAGGRDLVLSRQRGQVQKHLNVGSLNEARIPLPPIELQRQFARRISALETVKGTHRTSLAELDALFASVQHRAFRGEL